MTTVLLSGGLSPEGERLDLRCDPATALIAAAAPHLTPLDGETVVDCTGKVLLPGPVEPHAHLDKALSAQAAPNPAGDLPGAIAAWRAYRPQLTPDEIYGRARAAALELVAKGTTTIRSHVDVGDGIGLRGIEAVSRVRDELRAEGLADLQVVALISPPVIGADGEAMRAMLREAMAAGADVVGGCPHIEPDPVEATRELVAIAAELGLPIDLHVDETLDPRILGLRAYAAEVAAAGAKIPGAVAGHCVSLGVQEPEVQAQLAAEVRDAGIAVVTLPQTNLYLQSRDQAVSPARGLTAVKALIDAGTCVCAGADNVRDPFNAVGRSDALETAALLVMAAHLSPHGAWHLCSNAGRQALNLPPVHLEPGDPAEVVAVAGASLADAIARASEDRVVVHRGAVVATTSVATTFQPRNPDATPVVASDLSTPLVPAQ